MKQKIVHCSINIVLFMFCFSGCTYFFSKDLWRNGRPIEFERRYFMSNNISIELPIYEDRVGYDRDKEYYAQVYSYWGGFGIGDLPISMINLRILDYDRYVNKGCNGQIRDNREDFVCYVEMSSKKTDGYFDYERSTEIIIGKKLFGLSVITHYNSKMLPDIDSRKIRIQEDDRIFKHLIDSLNYKSNGKWIMPTIIWKGPKESKYIEP